MRKTRSIASWVAVVLTAAGVAAAEVDRRVVQAAKQGDKDAVQALIKQRADVNAPEADGTTALHWAVRSDQLDTVTLLIRAGANAKAVNRYGVTPLSLAATGGNAGVIEMLIKAGADPNDTREEGETVLMTAARTGKADAVKVLLAHGADVNAKEGWYGQTAVMWAAAENHASVVQALVDRGADVNARSKVLEPPKREITDFRTDKKGQALQTLLTTFPRAGLTPLLFAARQGALQAAGVLVAAGADLNLPDPDGIAPLSLAIRNGHDDVAAFLIEKGANVNAADSAGRTPLYTAVDVHTLDWIQNRPAPKSSGPLNSLDVVKLLLDRGADPNAQLKAAPPGWKGDAVAAQNTFGGVLGPGTTAFVRAAKNADLALMRLLLEKGANPNLTTRNHTTALMAAVGGLGRKYGANLQVTPEEEKSVIEAATLCLERGADVNAANDAGLTALHGAAMLGANGLVQFLAHRGAKLDAKAGQGRTPLDEALRGTPNIDGAPGDPHEDTAALLRQLMAKQGVSAKADKPTTSER